MDSILTALVPQLPLAVLIFIAMDRSYRAQALERRRMDEQQELERKRISEQQEKERLVWQTWMENITDQLSTIIQTNTAMLSKNTEVLGEVSASRLSCPAAMGPVDRDGGPLKRRMSNGSPEVTLPPLKPFLDGDKD